MTNKNFNLIYEIVSDSRTPLRTIGKKIRCSQQYVSYNLKNLHEKEDILDYFVLFDYARFGYLRFSVYFKNLYLNQTMFSKIISSLKKNLNVTSVFEVGGRYDLFVGFSTKNPSRFNKVLKSLISKYPELGDYIILIDVVKHIYPRQYLVKKRKFDFLDTKNDIIIGGDREKSKILPEFMNLLKALHNNPRQQIVSLSNELGISTKTCLKRMRILEDQKIIRGYKGVLNFQNLGINSNRIFIRLNNPSSEEENELLTYLKMNKNIIQSTKLLGKWDLSIDIETFSVNEFRRIYLDIRERFKDIIKDSDTSPIYKIHKQKYMPDEGFQT